MSSGPDHQRTILHIDMNSYFASVEQQARPSLRGKPIGVIGPSKRSIIIAASSEAKKLGIKTGTQIWEAKKLCPQISLIRADCNRYESITRQFLEIFIKQTPIVEVFSIDEAFLDLSDQVRNFEDAENIARRIKNEIRNRIGEDIKCSAGIAKNKFMAKLASEAKKPDGLTVVPRDHEIEFLDRFELSDACGIGRGTLAHLQKLGIKNFSDLRRMSQTNLTAIFNSYGPRLYNMARAIDTSPVIPCFCKNKVKSISRSKTLAKNTRNEELPLKIILSFCQNITSELRKEGLLAGSIGIWLRYDDFTHHGKSRKISSPSQLTNSLYLYSKKIFETFHSDKPIRKIALVVGELVTDCGQLSIFPHQQKLANIEKTVDLINNKYGSELVTRSSLINIMFSGKSPSYGFKKHHLLEKTDDIR